MYTFGLHQLQLHPPVVVFLIACARTRFFKGTCIHFPFCSEFFDCISIACEGMLVIRRHVNSVHDLQGGCGTANGVSWQPACRLPCRRRGLRHSASFYSFQTSWGVFPLLDWTQVLSTGVTGLGRCVCRMLGLHNLQVVVF